MTKNVYTGRIITLNVDTVTLPNGLTVDLEVVRHPGAAAVVPLKDDGTVILIRQFRHAAGGFIYEIPAGNFILARIPESVRLENLKKKSGTVPARLDLLSSIFTAPGFTDEVIHIYKATGLTIGRQQLDRDEVLEVIEMPLSEAIGMIETGVIRDAKSIVGLQAVYLRSRSR